MRGAPRKASIVLVGNGSAADEPCSVAWSMEIACLAIVIGFFALSWAFIVLCDRVGE